MESKGNANKISVRNSESGKFLERSWCRRQLNIKINFGGIASDNVDFIYFWAMPQSTDRLLEQHNEHSG
jgi:hypothetical protein